MIEMKVVRSLWKKWWVPDNDLPGSALRYEKLGEIGGKNWCAKKNRI